MSHKFCSKCVTIQYSTVTVLFCPHLYYSFVNITIDGVFRIIRHYLVNKANLMHNFYLVRLFVSIYKVVQI